MKSFKHLIVCLMAMTAVLSLSSCHEIEEYENNPEGNFEALWKIIDEHYCFFGDNGVDWKKVYDEFRPQVNAATPRDQLFDICSKMLDRLEDGHVNLSSTFAVSYYRKWWSDYPANYDERIVQQFYLNFDYRQLGGVYYGILSQNVGYVRYPSFSYGLGQGNLDHILHYLRNTNGLVIDLRDNGGGDMTNSEDLITRFLTEETLVGYILHKTGPGHDDFSDPYPIKFKPPTSGRITWLKPVVVLVNRSTFSAANFFVMVMKSLPRVRIVGDVTGGGAGMPLSMEIPNGWGIRMSACPILDSEGKSTERGISPSEGCKIDLDPEAALKGVDTMLDKAIETVLSF